jgi:hypothetical protein
MDKRFPEGIRLFNPHENAPEWVKQDVSINKDEFGTWLAGEEPDAKGYVKLQILQPRDESKGLYLAVNDYKPREDAPQQTQTGGGDTDTDNGDTDAQGNPCPF